MKPLLVRSRINCLLTRTAIMAIKRFQCHENHREGRKMIDAIRTFSKAFYEILKLLLFTHESYALYRKFNLTEFIRNIDHEPYQDYHSYDIPYLSEDSFDEKRNIIEELQPKRDGRTLMPEYRNLCEVVTRKVQLSDSEYEYQPSHYHEIFCKSYSLLGPTERLSRTSKQKCAHPGFHCIQKSRTLFMVRRLWESDCWEPFTKEIASGCDCMWPVSVLGEITGHY